MSGIPMDLEEQLKELVANGNKIAAIKLYREATGVSLSEAKEVVDTIALGSPPNLSTPGQADKPDSFLENRIKNLLAERKKIEAVKVYREAYNCGLKEAKDAVDLIQADMRREGYSTTSSIPVTNNDPFAEDTQRNRRFLVLTFAIVLLVIAGAAFLLLAGNGF